MGEGCMEKNKGSVIYIWEHGNINGFQVDTTQMIIYEMIRVSFQLIDCLILLNLRQVECTMNIVSVVDFFNQGGQLNCAPLYSMNC